MFVLLILRPCEAEEAVTTLAGSVLVSGSLDGPATNALFSDPTGLAIDGAGNIYIADNQNHTIRKLGTDGFVSTLAGSAGVSGSKDSTGTNASFNNPSGIVFSTDGKLYVTDTGNHTIRGVSTNGIVTTLAGLHGLPGSDDGTNDTARFNTPLGIAVDTNGTLYIADTGNHLIRKITGTGVVTTLAGSPGVWGSSDSPALFNGPVGVAVDSRGNVFIADANNHTLRKITPAGIVSTFAGRAGVDGSADGTGSEARFGKPAEMKIDRSDNIFVVDSFNHTVRRVSPEAVVSTVAGLPGSGGSANGYGSTAHFFNPYGLAIDHNGNLRISDTYNQTIRFAYDLITATISQNPDGSFNVGWQAVAGNRYQVQFRTPVDDWQNLGAPVAASGSFAFITDQALTKTNERFYRVKLLP